MVLTSRYADDLLVKWRARYDEVHAAVGCEVDVPQLLTWIPLPLYPPKRTCESHIAADPCAALPTFHSTTIAPAIPLVVVNTISEISVAAVSPATPTWTATWGLEAEANLDPEATMLDHNSPTTNEPAGILSVSVIRYVPASITASSLLAKAIKKRRENTNR